MTAHLFGELGTAVITTLIGLFFTYYGYRKLDPPIAPDREWRRQQVKRLMRWAGPLGLVVGFLLCLKAIFFPS
jgi:hypothetical protein